MIESVRATDGYSPQMMASDAEARAADWLAKGNRASERGNRDLAERHYAKAQRWLDKANELRGNN